MKPRVAISLASVLIFLILLSLRAPIPGTGKGGGVDIPTLLPPTAETEPIGDDGKEPEATDEGERETGDGEQPPMATNGNAEGGLLRVMGDASGNGPRSLLLRMLVSVVREEGSFLDPKDWPSHDYWEVKYNRSLSRTVPEAYLRGSKEFEEFFTRIEGRGVVPIVVNGSTLVEGPLAGPLAIKLADLRGMGDDSGLYHTPVKDEPTEGTVFDHIKKLNQFAKTPADLEFAKSVPAVYYWQRALNDTEARWAARDDETYTRVSNGTSLPLPRSHRSAVRVACLYAGFVRDYIRMFISCLDKNKSYKKCANKYVNKLFGSQRENILDSMGCDVFASTWDIVGTGRYDTSTYKNVKYNVDQFKGVYGARLAGLHIQDYSVYERVWRIMASRARAFPQTRPLHSVKIPASWTGAPENNFFFRVNDYSQSYKQWCVVQLALLSKFNYDVFFRLRFDLRAVRSISNFRFAHIVTENGSEPERAIAYDISGYKEDGGGLGTSEASKKVLTHFISSKTMFVQNFDYADFGFMASPSLIHLIAAVWYYCLMPRVEGLPVQYLSQGFHKPGSDAISEYNLVLWRLIWENKLLIDNGGIVLRISRRGDTPKGGGKRKR